MIKLILLIIILIIITYKYININININIRDFFVSRRKEDFVFALKIQLLTQMPDVGVFEIYDENKVSIMLNSTENPAPMYQRGTPDKKIPLYTKTNKVKYIICFFYYVNAVTTTPTVHELLIGEDGEPQMLGDLSVSDDNVGASKKYIIHQNINLNLNDMEVTDQNFIIKIREKLNTIDTYIDTYIDNLRSVQVIQIELQNDIWNYSDLILEVI